MLGFKTLSVALQTSLILNIILEIRGADRECRKRVETVLGGWKDV